MIGYGSLLSGYGMLAERRGGGSQLVARDAFPVRLRNARRGLAKPSSHGHYLAMDLEPIDASEPIVARAGRGRCDRAMGSALLGLVFDREWAPLIARREEYDPAKFLELIELADRAGQPLGEFLLEIARRTRLQPARLSQRALRDCSATLRRVISFIRCRSTDGRVAIAAIGSGFDGSGDPAVRSKRNEYGMDRLLTLREALARAKPSISIARARSATSSNACSAGFMVWRWPICGASFDLELDWAGELHRAASVAPLPASASASCGPPRSTTRAIARIHRRRSRTSRPTRRARRNERGP